MIASINSIPPATPVISANTPVFHCSSVTPGQVTPVTTVKTPEVPSLQITNTTAASHSSLSVNTQANLNEGNNSFKRIDCTPATVISYSSQAVSILLSIAPGPQVVSLSHPFHQPRVLTAQASALSHPPCHSPRSRDQHFRNSRNFTYTATLSDACPTQHPPDHVTSLEQFSSPYHRNKATLT